MAEGGEGGEGGGVGEKYPYGEYVGARDENLDRHGYGSALLPNGDIYEGNYRRGKRHNKGIYCFRNGARYEGDWRKGLKHGFGTFNYPDGSKYIGQWRKDFKHGHGIYYYCSGDVYEGTWYRGQRHGLGTYSYIKEKVLHFGVWHEGKMEGAGVTTYPCDFRFHGKFRRNLPIGAGIFTFENKWIQYGFYINIRDPAFDYLGAENLAIDEHKANEEEIIEEDNTTPAGIVPIWRARHTVAYTQELVPPDPYVVPIKDSEDSLLDIIDYLKQYEPGTKAGDEEEDYEHLERPAPATSPISVQLNDFDYGIDSEDKGVELEEE